MNKSTWTIIGISLGVALLFTGAVMVLESTQSSSQLNTTQTSRGNITPVSPPHETQTTGLVSIGYIAEDSEVPEEE